MSDDSSYNGWTNWATFQFGNALLNVEDWYHEAQGKAAEDETGDALMEWATKLFWSSQPSNHPSDEMTRQAIMNQFGNDWTQLIEEFTNVNWLEIRDALIS